LELMDGCQSMREKQPATFTLAEPEYVYGVQLRYVFTHSDRYPSLLRIAWTCADGAGKSATVHVIHDRHVQTLMVPVEGVIETISLETQGDPSRLDVYALDLLCRQ